MNDQKTLIEDLICFGSRYDLESCSLAAKVIEEQEKLIRKLQSENKNLRADLERAQTEAARLREALEAYTARDLEWEEQLEHGFKNVEKSPEFREANAALGEEE